MQLTREPLASDDHGVSAPRARSGGGLESGSSDSRLGYIDTLRALAALLVVWRHVSETYWNVSPATAATRWVYDWSAAVDSGRIGVVLFFAISGFVIPYSIRMDRRAPIRDFLLRRAFRIFPLYWLSIPVGASMQIMWGGAFPVRFMLMDAVMLQFVLGGPSAIGLYWTLFLEVLFYLSCALLMFARSIDKPARLAVISMVLIAVHLVSVGLFSRGDFTTLPWLTSLWFLHLGIMFWGSLYRAWLEGQLHGPFENAAMWGILILLLALCPLLCGLLMRFPLNYYLPYTLAMAGFVAGTTVFKCSWRPLARLGVISYSIYMLHPIVFGLLRWILLVHVQPTSWLRTQHLATYVLVNMVLTILAAAITYRYVEKPMMAVGKRLSERWLGRRDGPSMAQEVV